MYYLQSTTSLNQTQGQLSSLQAKEASLENQLKQLIAQNSTNQATISTLQSQISELQGIVNLKHQVVINSSSTLTFSGCPVVVKGNCYGNVTTWINGTINNAGYLLLSYSSTVSSCCGSSIFIKYSPITTTSPYITLCCNASASNYIIPVLPSEVPIKFNWNSPSGNVLHFNLTYVY